MAIKIQKGPGPQKPTSVTLRVTPKFKLGLELLARKKQTNMSMLVMEVMRAAIDDKDSGLGSIRVAGRSRPLVDVVWDPLLPDREVKLARHAPDLLTDREKVRWTIISENRSYWLDSEEPDLKKIREKWKEIEKQTDDLININFSE